MWNGFKYRRRARYIHHGGNFNTTKHYHILEPTGAHQMETLLSTGVRNTEPQETLKEKQAGKWWLPVLSVQA